MDKYEFKLKSEEMKVLASAHNYKAAAEIAESIRWDKVRNLNVLVMAGDIFEQVGRFEDSKRVFQIAYDKSPISRSIISRLAELAIKTKDFEEANDHYNEFVDIAPHDNLKYVLKYKILAAQGVPYKQQITVLEELKDQEYSEEWAYELAYLYHRDGQPDKCVALCDELILYFGDGEYVEKALELKMHYQPLTKLQEEKYRQFRQKRTGVIEVKPEDFLESGEIVNKTVSIPSVIENTDKFNTTNLQKEIQRGMQQIIEAQEKEDVTIAIDHIRKKTKEIPYLSLPEEDEEGMRAQKEAQALEDEIDRQVDQSINKILHDEQQNLERHQAERNESEEEPSDSRKGMGIEEILAEWERTKQATQAVLREAEERKLESAKEQALHEAEGLLDKLNEIMPQLTSGMTPKELLENKYLEGTGLLDQKQQETASVEDNIEEAGQIVAGMNQIMQNKIDELKAEQYAEEGRKEPVLHGNGTKQKETGNPSWVGEPTRELPKLPSEVLETDTLESVQDIVPSKEEQAGQPQAHVEEQTEEPQAYNHVGIHPEESQAYGNMNIHPDPYGSKPDSSVQNGEYTGITAYSKEEETEAPITHQETEEISEEDLKEAAAAAGFSSDAEEPEQVYTLDDVVKKAEKELEKPVIKKDARLTPEQRKTFSFFMPIAGMEVQIANVLENVISHLQWEKNSLSGNILIEGINGNGNPILVTNIIKALQHEVKRPSGNIGKIDAVALNLKDIAVLTDKVKGGCLIIESAGKITRETVVKLSKCMERDRSGTLYILEDSKLGIQKVMERDSSFAAKFTERITIPVFTSDELVAFGKAYANEYNYDIDEMGILALYKRINNIQKPDHITTLTEVKDIVDEAIEHAEKGTLKKMFGMFTSNRYNEENFIILHEKDFEEV